MVRLFGCQHKHVTWPQKRAPHTYIVCLDCGKEMLYDWQQMKVTGERKVTTYRFEWIGEQSK